MNNLFILAGLFVCHFLADFTPLSRPFMLQAKAKGYPLYPIALHALVHGGLMLMFFMFVLGPGPMLFELFFIQVLTHFIIDTWKGKMNVWFPDFAVPKNPSHWVLFGFDQLLHTLVIIFMYSLID